MCGFEKMESRSAMLKMKQLFWLERIVSLIMMFAMGFGLGTAFPETPVIYWVSVIGIGAFAKIELYHYAQKLQKLEQHENSEN